MGRVPRVLLPVRRVEQEPRRLDQQEKHLSAERRLTRQLHADCRRQLSQRTNRRPEDMFNRRVQRFDLVSAQDSQPAGYETWER